MNNKILFRDGVSQIQEQRLRSEFEEFAKTKLTDKNFNTMKKTTEGIYATIGGHLAQLREEDNIKINQIKEELKVAEAFGITKDDPYYKLYELCVQRIAFGLKNITWRNISDEIIFKYIEKLEETVQELFDTVNELERENSNRNAELKIMEAQNVAKTKEIEEKIRVKIAEAEILRKDREAEREFELKKLKIEKELERNVSPKLEEKPTEKKQPEGNKKDELYYAEKELEDLMKTPPMDNGIKKTAKSKSKETTTEQKIEIIKERLSRGVKKADIARELGVNSSYVHGLIKIHNIGGKDGEVQKKVSSTETTDDEEY